MITSDFWPLLNHVLSDESTGYDASESLRYISAVIPALALKTPAKFEHKVFNYLYKHITEYPQAPSRSIFYEKFTLQMDPEDVPDLQDFSNRLQAGLLNRIDVQDTQVLLDDYEKGRDIYLMQQAFTTALEIYRGPVKIDGRELRGFEDCLDYAQRKISLLGTSGTKVHHHTLSEDGEDLYAYYLEDQREYATAKRIKTGINDIDQAVEGFRPGELITLMGYTGDGKTTLCVNWAYQAFLQGRHVVYATLEMPADEIKKRFHIRHACHPKFGRPPISSGAYTNFKLSEEQEQFIFREVVPDFEKNSTAFGSIRVLEPVDSGFTYDMLKAELLKLNAEQPVDAFYLDYPNLMEIRPERGMDYDRAMSRLYVQLKGLCRTFNNGQRITGFIPTQVNKAGRAAAETNDGEYSLRAINQYSEIPNSSDFVFYTFRDQTLMDNNECVMGCLKARRCERPKKFRAAFVGATGIISSIETLESGPASGGMNANISGFML